MRSSKSPTNLAVLDTQKPAVRALAKITTLDIFNGATQELHPEGLFSTEIFGRIGDPKRDKTFARIELKVPVFDPNIYDILITLKGLYTEIMAGRKFAVFDEDERDFVPSDPTKGDTGFDFFFKHWKKIEFRRTNSDRRDVKIRNIYRYKDVAEIKNVIVLPAGLRDIEIAEGGRPEEHEVNALYRKVISASRVIEIGEGTDYRAVNTSRYMLQRAIHEIWQYFMKFTGGKDGFFMRKVASRNVENGTRNVISAMDATPAVLGRASNFNVNHTQVGIMQTAKGLLPVTKGNVRRHLIKHVFSDTPGDMNARLVRREDLMQETVQVPFKERDYWMTSDGLGRMITNYQDVSLRDRPIIIQDHYLGLVYEGLDQTFKLFHGIQFLPEGFDRSRVRPMTMTDLIYLTNYKDWEDKFVLPTRYPTTGLGSIYPSRPKVTSTIPAEVRTELNDDWEVDEWSGVCASYPIRGKGTYFDTMAVHPTRLKNLGGDHDGDMVSGNYIYSVEAIEELNGLMRKATTYLNPKGGMLSSVSYYTTDLIAHNLTRDV